MRTSSRLAQLAAFALVLGAAPAFALDGTVSPNQPTPMEAFRSGARALKVGETEKGVMSLEYAAQQGHAMAQWKLGRMYAEGDGVTRNDLRAFQYFSRIANTHADDTPGTPQARFVASAFVALGHYYLEGIPQSDVKRDAVRAHEMFRYAASYFGDPEAQYYLGRLYLEGTGATKDAKQAARWFQLAAHKSQTQAQAMLGAMLFAGQDVPRQAAQGLMLLTLAKDNKDMSAADQGWVTKLYESAYAQSTEEERALALIYLQRWLGPRAARN